MGLRPLNVEVTVEREVPALDERPGRTIRLTARLEPTTPGVLPTAEDLHETLEALTVRLDTAVELSGASPTARRGPDRELAELIETYRPRQAELVDLLLAEGELSPREASLLRPHVGARAAGPVPTLAAAPKPAIDRPAQNPRPVEELLATYQIHSLKQAGAVRARRQISFAEYMELKRHFVPSEETSEANRP